MHRKIQFVSQQVEVLGMERKWMQGLGERVDHWMINEGSRRLFVATFFLLHLLVFTVGLVNYTMKVRKLPFICFAVQVAHSSGYICRGKGDARGWLCNCESVCSRVAP